MRISDWSSDVCSSDLVFVAPEEQRHARKGSRADQFAHLANHRPPPLVPSLDRGAQMAALKPPRRVGQFGVAGHEGSGDFGAAADVAPPDIRPAERGKLRATPALNVRGKRRAGTAERANSVEIADPG